VLKFKNYANNSKPEKSATQKEKIQHADSGTFSLLLPQAKVARTTSRFIKMTRLILPDSLHLDCKTMR